MGEWFRPITLWPQSKLHLTGLGQLKHPPLGTHCCLKWLKIKTFQGAHQNKTSSARAEISDGPHKGGLKRAGPNDFMFVYNLVQRDLSISMLFVFIFLFC